LDADGGGFDLAGEGGDGFIDGGVDVARQDGVGSDLGVELVGADHVGVDDEEEEEAGDAQRHPLGILF